MYNFFNLNQLIIVIVNLHLTLYEVQRGKDNVLARSQAALS